METINTVTQFLVEEKDKIVEYQTQSWTDAKVQLATNAEQVTESVSYTHLTLPTILRV